MLSWRADTPQARKRAQHRQPLLERQSDRRIDDEQADEKRQQAERGQVEMKAVGQAFEIALGIGGDQTQPVADDRFERRARALGFADQQPRDLVRAIAAAVARRRYRPPARPAPSAAAHAAAASVAPLLVSGVAPSARPSSASVSGATSVWPGGVTKACRSALADRRRVADFDRQRYRLDPQQPERAAADLNAAFEHRRHRPAGAAQIDKQLLRKAQCRRARPALAFARRRRSRRRGRSSGAPAGSAPARRSTARSPRSARSAGSQAASDAAANG